MEKINITRQDTWRGIYFCGNGLPTSVTEIAKDMSGFYYRATGVDALISDVQALVEAAKEIDPAIDVFNNAREDISLAKKVAAFNVLFNASDRLTEAIAAVERYLEPKCNPHD